MKKLYFATANQAKLASLKRDLAGLNIEIKTLNFEIPEPRSDETDMIAKEKVRFAYSQIKKPCLAQDGGFYIPALNGFPKAYVNFALGTIGLAGILKLVEGFDRSCEFRDSFAYLDESLDEPLAFTTITKGTLAKEPRGELHAYNWGELHKIFIPEGGEKTFTEMSAEEMDNWRGSRMDDWCGKKLALWLQGY